MDSLENLLNDLGAQMGHWIKIVEQLNLSKADVKDMNENHKDMLARQNDIVEALTKQFADKNDTKKTLKLLER